MHKTNLANGEGPTVPAVSPPESNQNSSHHCASVRADGQAHRSYTRRLADVTAKLGLRGFSLYPLHDESLLVAQWGMSKVLPSIEAAERFSRIVGSTE